MSKHFQRLKDLRVALQLTQAQLSAKLHVAQSLISDWESQHGKEPSAEIYIRFGNFPGLPKEDALWLFEQAGMDRENMLRVTEPIRGERQKKAKTIYVPRLREKAAGDFSGGRYLRKKDDKKALWAVPAKEVPNPGGVAYWEGKGRGIIHRPGSRVLLDISDDGSTSLRPFWGAIVLLQVRHAPEEEEETYIGELGVEPLGPLDYHAVLFPFTTIEWRHGHRTTTDLPTEPSHIPVGYWRFEATRDKEQLKKTGSGEVDADLVRKRAEREIQLFPNMTILGRVIGISISGVSKELDLDAQRASGD